jgi:transcriptional regulator with XRE-family HTH domain
MHLQTYSSVNYDPLIRVFIKRTQDTLGLEDEEISDQMKVSRAFYKKIMSGQSSASVHSLKNLADNYNLSLEAIKHDQVDYETILEHKKGNLDFIAKKYTVGAYSKRRTVTNFLDYIKNFVGYELFEEVERYFQLNHEIYSNQDGFINIRFFEDIYKYVKERHNFTGKMFYDIGRYNIVTNKNTVFAQSLRELESPSQLFEHFMLDLINLIEHNSSYKVVSIDENVCVVESVASEKVQDELKVKRIGSRETCIYRAGALAVVPSYISYPEAIVKETKCVHKGDCVCRFEIDYSHANFLKAKEMKVMQPLQRLHIL